MPKAKELLFFLRFGLKVKSRDKKQYKNRLNQESSDIKKNHFVAFAEIIQIHIKTYHQEYKKQQIQCRREFDQSHIFKNNIQNGQ